MLQHQVTTRFFLSPVCLQQGKEIQPPREADLVPIVVGTVAGVVVTSAGTTFPAPKLVTGCVAVVIGVGFGWVASKIRQKFLTKEDTTRKKLIPKSLVTDY